jgi:ParB/RepB/Spo0J family partition protein
MASAESVLRVPLAELDERYASLRVPRPRQEQAVAESLGRLGQLTPVVVCQRADRLAVVDGFKRLRAARSLSLDGLHVRVLPLSEEAAVAAVYSLNRHGHGLVDLEEALVIRTLVREHGLSQVEVATLLGRHASWVCRRLALLERLDERVQGDVRVGLVSTTVARELARLPRGNQAEVAAAVHQSGLTSREASQLVTLFEQTAHRGQQESLLTQPREALARQRGGPEPAPWDPRLGPRTNRLRRQVLGLMSSSQQLVMELARARPAAWSDQERPVLRPVLEQLARAVDGLGQSLAPVLQALEQADVTDGS